MNDQIERTEAEDLIDHYMKTSMLARQFNNENEELNTRLGKLTGDLVAWAAGRCKILEADHTIKFDDGKKSGTLTLKIECNIPLGANV